MSRWTADSDYDYQEDTGNGPVRWPLCATPDCGRKAAAFSCLCSACNVEQEQRNAQHRQESATERKGRIA